MKAYNNVGIKEHDKRSEKEIVAKKEGREEKEAEMILEMNKEGFRIQQIAKASKKVI